MKRERKRRDVGFLIIAVFKLIKGVLLLAVGIGALSLLHGNLLALMTQGADAVQVSAQNQLLQELLQRFGLLNPKQIVLISALTSQRRRYAYQATWGHLVSPCVSSAVRLNSFRQARKGAMKLE